MSPRPADTLGPFGVASAPSTISIRGFGRERDAPCPFGGLAEMRVLDPDRPALAMDGTDARALTIGPDNDLGHRIEPTLWVGGRGLSRYRPGLPPTPEVEGLSLVVIRAAPLRFAPEPLPAGGESALDIIVTLTDAKVGPDTRLVVSVDDVDVATIDPPDEHAGTWQSEPQSWQPSAAVVRLSVRLEGGGASDRVAVRDIGLFSRGPVVAGEIVRE
jgi:hypothetical protein